MLCAYRAGMRIDTVNASPQPTEPDSAPFGLSLQLSRASMMALTRLQLAIQSGDRQATMAAMDRLHTLDAEMERLVAGLPARPDDDPEWRALSRHVSDQKLALAFEKLALVSEISGPDLVSPGASPLPRTSAAQDSDGPPPLRDWPILPDVQPTVWKSIPAGVIGFILALAVTSAIVAAVVLMTPL
jgi:hypothetical protein